VTAPRVEIDLDAIAHNARTLVGLLEPKGIRVTGIAKATLGSRAVAEAMLAGGVSGIGDSRVENLTRLRASGIATALTLIRAPMVSQADAAVRCADTSLNSEVAALRALSAAALRQHTTHGVIVMVELGDLREGALSDEIVDLARKVSHLPGLRLAGLGTNLACQSGVVPDQVKMDELSALVERVELACRTGLAVVSGGNSANLDWALAASDVGRVDELRLGEAILLGTEPLHRRPIDGLRTDAFTLAAELIEVKTKPAQSWGDTAQAAFGALPPRVGSGMRRQAIVALGRQDVDPHGLTAPAGITVLGASSDHLVLDLGDHGAAVGDELRFGLDYSALLRTMTSPFVAKAERGGDSYRNAPRPVATTPALAAVGR
jgi:predicted amino acid racemase